jgi:hypothetical protein
MEAQKNFPDQLDRSRKQQSQLQQELNMQQQSKDAYPDGN